MLAHFLSPDPYVQAPDYTQNFNRYSYCLNNPFKYTDPSGKFIFTALCLMIPGAQFLLPVAIGADIGWITGGIKSTSQGGSFWDGAWKGGVVGVVGGALSMVGGGAVLANVAWGAVEGAVTGTLNAALWGENIGKGALWGTVTGAAFGFLTSENTVNLVKGKGFNSNDKVLENFRLGKYALKEGSTWQQDALNYFGFKGKYNPQGSGPKNVEGKNMYIAYTEVKTGEINIGDLAFPTSSNQFNGGFDRLKMHYYKELFHHNRIISGIQLAQQTNVPSELKFYPEERLGYIHLYKN